MQILYTIVLDFYIEIKKRLVKFTIQFMIANTQNIYKLQIYIKFFFAIYKENEIKTL